MNNMAIIYSNLVLFSGILKLLGHARRSRSIQKNLEEVIYQYMWHGVNTSGAIQQPYGVNCQYMLVYLLNQYIESLCSPKPDNNTSMAQTLSGNPVIKWLVNTMTYNAMCTASQINLRIIATTDKPTDIFTSSLIRFVTGPPLLRLKTLAARVIWFSVERQKNQLQSLPIPKHMKHSFLDIITKEI